MSRPLPSGDPVRLGPFRLTARLTENAAGIVYLAVDDEGRRASLAVLSRDAADDAAARDRFRAAILAGLAGTSHAPGHVRAPGSGGGSLAAPGPVPGVAASTLTESTSAAPAAAPASDAGGSGGADGQDRPVFAAPDGAPGADGAGADAGAGAGGVAEILAAQPDGPAPWVATAYDGHAVGAERFLEPVVPRGALRGRWGGVRRRGPLFQPYWAGGTGEPALAPRPGPPVLAGLPAARPPERGLVAAILTLAGVLGVLAVLLLVLFACQPTVKTPPPQPPEPTLESPSETPPPSTPASPSPSPTPTPRETSPVTPGPSGSPGDDGGGSV